MSDSKTILVTGATGQQGGSVAAALLEEGHRVRALTRRPESARHLADRGAEIAAGDFIDPASLVAAAQGVDTVFLMSDSWSAGPAAEAANGLTAVDALKDTGIGHMVYSSVASADRDTGIPHFDSKSAIEQRLAASGLPFTVVAPVAFMDNATAPWAIDPLLDGTLAMALPARRKLQQVAVSDIGRVVAAVVEGGDAYFGRRIEIAGDDPSGEEMAAALGRAMRRPVRYVELPLETLRQQNAEAATMFAWFDKVGYSVDIPALRRAFPQVGWQTFADWANGVDWTALATRPAAAAGGGRR